MKKIITIIAILFSSVTFAQECKLTLADLLTIDSSDSFQRILIENNFENISSMDLLEEELEFTSSKDTLALSYGFTGWTKYSSSQSIIMVIGKFSKKSETFGAFLIDVYANDEYSVYNAIFSQVKDKCTFDRIVNDDDDYTKSFYNCPKARFNSGIGFGIKDGNGMILFGNHAPEEMEEQSSISSNEEETGRKNLESLNTTMVGLILRRSFLL